MYTRSRATHPARASGPRMLIRGSRSLTEPERQALADGGRHTHYNEGLLTLECGHHVIRIMPKWTGATSALCRLCGDDALSTS